MKYSLLPLLATVGVALTACEVDAAPESQTPGDVVINQTAALSAYPGTSSNEVVSDGDDTRTTFAADASLPEVYEHFHSQLTAQGWGRTDLEQDDDEVEADYRREGQELELELERDDGGFELEIDIGADNSGYDEDNGPGDDDSGDDGDDDSSDDGSNSDDSNNDSGDGVNGDDAVDDGRDD